MAIRNTIVQGPSKWDLMLSLFDGDSKSRRTVTFVATAIKEETGKPVSFPLSAMVITSLKRVGDEDWRYTAFSQVFGEDSDALPYHGSYNTHTRKGWLELVEK